MIHKFIKTLQKVEKQSNVYRKKDNTSGLSYKRFGKVWIRADIPIKDQYTKSLKYSELRFYPSTNYKAWALWILRIFKFKKSSLRLKELLGIGLYWPFLKTEYLPLHADMIYGRMPSLILIYTSVKEQKVVKVALTKAGKLQMKSEIASQRLASAITSKDIFIPKILSEYHDEDIDYSIEEYFAGKKHSFKDKKKLKVNYHKVFRYLMKFYLKNPIKLQNLSENKFLNHDFVEKFIKEQDHGELAMSTYNRLYAKKKNMILCRIHGDLSHGNVLSNKEEVCIIDWGKSKLHYLARDLDSSSYNTKDFYNEFLEKARIDENGVYSYKEQLFLGRFIEMSRLIHNGIKRKTINNHLYNWVKSQNEVLLRMSKDL
ncbi:phosphotransferase [Mesonia ostreae]|uniref:Aminoglycoside phosphotransferase domain-containing protein n=1 Tax=Mesonia ostreae TaxID=861110 RepID=A0ABU2KM26_9FLAO|nr:hypothetical protein [Mesonia ostreae]MDT0295766.1 hypothetical protein [Mesonia ostreae]